MEGEVSISNGVKETEVPDADGSASIAEPAEVLDEGIEASQQNDGEAKGGLFGFGGVTGANSDDDDEPISRKRNAEDAESDEERQIASLTPEDAEGKQQRKKKKKSKSTPEAEQEEGGESQILTEDYRRRLDLMARIDAAAKGTKKRPKKKADETDLEQAADDEIVRMRDTMMSAAEEDREANELKRPATAKLRMLKEAVDTLQKTGYQQAIQDNNLLEAVRMWLDPLPDKSLPSLNIQRALFPLLEKMYIDTTSLKMSGLGKLVLFYTRCDRVDRDIARIADRLIETWSRPILKRSSSYRDRQQARREYQADPYRSAALRTQQATASQTGSQANQRVRIPEAVTGNSFAYAPASHIADHPDESQATRMANRQKINKFKRSMQAAKTR